MNASGFCHWLEGVLDFVGEDGLTDAQIEMVKAKLAEAFIGDIDKQYPSHLQKTLHDAHAGAPAESPFGKLPPGARC